MAEVNFSLAVVAGVQAAAGVAEPSIAGLVDGGGSGAGGAIDPTDGLILGDPGSGVGESGVSLAFARSLRQKAPLAGSFTRPPSDLIGRIVRQLQLAVPLKGNGATATPADAEFQPLAGLDSVLQGVGWAGAAWGSGDGWIYTPAAVQRLTCKLWLWDDDAGPDQALAVVLKDVIGGWQIACNPSEIGVLQADLGGSYESHAVENLPTFDYGTQATLSAPSVESVGFTYKVTRDFVSMQLRGDNSTQEVRRSNAAGGVATRQQGRAITMQGGILVDSGDLAFELDELGRSGIAVDPFSFTVGSPAGAGQTINAWRFRAPTPELFDLVPDASGVDGFYTAQLAAKSLSANAEAELIFL